MPTPTDLAVLAFIFVLGSAIGSFLNVCIHRMPRGQSIVWPASYCPSCQAPIRPLDNIPIIGYLRLRGRCRACRTPIPVRYPIVEAVTGLSAAGCAAWLGLTAEGAALFLFFALLFTGSLIDAEHRIIPNQITFPGILLGLGLSFFRTDITWAESLWGIGVGGVVLLAIRQLGQWIFKKESMGLGDIKLIAMIGAFVGWQGAVTSVFLGSVLGTVYSLPLLVREARTGERGDHLIPFGPFLSGGGLLVALLIELNRFYWPL